MEIKTQPIIEIKKAEIKKNDEKVSSVIKNNSSNPINSLKKRINEMGNEQLKARVQFLEEKKLKSQKRYKEKKIISYGPYKTKIEKFCKDMKLIKNTLGDNKSLEVQAEKLFTDPNVKPLKILFKKLLDCVDTSPTNVTNKRKRSTEDDGDDKRRKVDGKKKEGVNVQKLSKAFFSATELSNNVGSKVNGMDNMRKHISNIMEKKGNDTLFDDDTPMDDFFM